MQVSSRMLEGKEVREQATDRLGMIFGKWINIKSRGSRLLSSQTRIRKKSSFYYEDDT